MGDNAPQPTATLMQMMVAISALLIAASALAITIYVWTSNRNSQLVQIGVGILQVDPKKHPEIQGAREWAIDLIDQNAGVKFSDDARRQLLNRPLVVRFNNGGNVNNGISAGGTF
ncbi:MAG: hypothetical protein JO208_01345 [Alphaproteobacteria bacterium]|nr:hypothetical protein [Alphaproteobacteria bacterium]MBV9670491.1 hypothetical protein [Terriglobales bacterium]